MAEQDPQALPLMSRLSDAGVGTPAERGLGQLRAMVTGLAVARGEDRDEVDGLLGAAEASLRP